jgi:CubicO group peptidase (beta-lactamase class C family)
MSRGRSVALVVAIALCIVPRSTRAQARANTQSAAASVASRGPRDAAEVEAFFDGLMIGQMKDKDIAGATVSVVRDGRVLFAKGYGWADLATHQPVSAESTLFRIGSISKLFTWTAVMQQVEAGKLDLHRDINDYLDFKIPATYAGPITLFNLMTHTPGFEDRAFALFSESTEPRGKFLAEHMPARVRPPGAYISYSNYGAALAGYIVERVTGLPWESYIEQRILEPLGIRNATGRQPLPPELAPQMSLGYAKAGATLVPKPFEIILPMAPAGSMSASALAMARFMIAQLQNGEYHGARILTDSIARFMHSRAFTQDARLDSYDYGFYEQTSHGVHLIGHGGDTQWFHSDLTLAPEQGWGIFVSYNSAPGGTLSFGPFLQAVLDHYYPVPTASLSDAVPPVDAGYLGTYRVNRGCYTTLEKIMGLFSALTVARDPEHAGVLVVRSPLGTQRFVATGDKDLFRQIDGNDRIAFQRDATQRHASHLFINSVPMMAMERLAWYQTPHLHQALLAIALLLLLTTPFVMLGSWLLHRRFRELAPLGTGERLARWTALLATGLAVAFCAGLVAVVSNPGGFVKGNAGALNVLLALPILLAAAAIALVGFSLRAWQRGWWGRWGRAHYTAVAVAAVVLVSVLAHWNVLGWKY